MKIEIVPTVFATTKKEFSERFARLHPLSKRLHIDIMDGTFVKAKSIMPEDIPPLPKDRVYDVHLMVADPLAWLPRIAGRGYHAAIVHIETLKTMQAIKEVEAKAKEFDLSLIFAKNPATPVEQVLKIALKYPIMCMGVVPGAEGQAFHESILEDLRQLRSHAKRATLLVDGGVTPFTAIKLAKAGVDVLYSGSYVSKSENPKQAMREIEKAAFRE